MKALFTFLLIFFAIGYTNAQIPGGNFESWNALVFEYPASSDVNIYTDDQASNETYGILAKTTDASDGTYALKFSSFGTGYFGYVLYGYMDDDAPGGGIPFADDPTQVTVSYKCNMAVNDSAQIWVWLYSDGTQVTTDMFKVGGVHTEYTDAIFNLSPYTAVIDSMLFGLVSGDPFVEEIRTDGNVVYFDNIRFNGTNNVQIPDNSFESWESVTKDFTEEMYNIRANVEKSTDAYNGDFALKMSTQEVEWEEQDLQMDYDARLTLWGRQDWINTGGDNWEVHLVGGLPVAERSDVLVFYYKFEPMAGVIDTASAVLKFSKNGDEVYNAYYELYATTTYQKMEIPFDLDNAWGGSVDADSMVLELQSSKWRDRYTWTPADVNIEGSSLYIDYMYFQSQLFKQAVTVGANGNITPGTTDVIQGSSITFTIIPDNGYEINTVTYNSVDVKGDLVDIGGNATYTIANVTGIGIFEVEFSLVSGTDDLDLNAGGISFFPNPTKGTLNLRGIMDDSLVEIISVTGVRVYQNQVNNNTTIDISNIPEGIYFVKINHKLAGKVVKH